MPSLRLKLFPLLLAACLMSGGAFAAEPTAQLQTMINRANEAANRQDYEAAIPLYEQAVRKLPPGHADAAHLRRNLGVLYANYAVTLEEQKRFDAALGWFDKALPLVAGDERQTKSIREGKAGALFAQAMDMRDTLANPASTDYARMRALLEQALQLRPGEPNIKKGLAGVYLDEAYRLATDEKYAEAMPLLEQALALDPQGKAVRQSLANVYLGMAKNEPPDDLPAPATTSGPPHGASDSAGKTADFANLKARRKAWIDKAIATEDTPRIRQAGERLLAEGEMRASTEAAATGKPSAFAAMPGNAKIIAPREISKLSVAEMVREMEKQLAIESPAKATIGERLEAVETQVLGKPQPGGLATRTKTAYTALMGGTDTLAGGADATADRQAPPASPDSYLAEIFKVTDGRIIRWGKFPLRVYIETPDLKAARSADKRSAKRPNEDAPRDVTPMEGASRDVTMDPFADNPIPMMQTTETEAGRTGEAGGDSTAAAAAVAALWRDDYKQAVLDGFNAWKDKTNGFVKFVEIRNPDAADIVVRWSDRYVDRYADPDKAPAVYKNYTPPRRTPLMRIVRLAAAVTPGYYGLAPQALNAALQYKEYQKLAAIREESKITLGLSPVQGLPPEQATLLIRNMAAKEFGHALGLKGTSPTPGDLMYPQLRHDAPQLPTQRDLATLQDLYNRPPNIVLNVR